MTIQHSIAIALTSFVFSAGVGFSSIRADEPNAEHGRVFQDRVAPVLMRRCLECHSGAEPAGGLDLSRKESLQKGGDSGAAVVPGKPDESLLWKRIAAGEMPPKRPPPAPEEQETLRKWIAAGAVWSGEALDPFRFSTDRRAGYDWWSLQPLASVAPPETQDDRPGVNGIDRWIVRQLAEHGLKPSPIADRRTLIRRLSFDLLGLPPSTDRVTKFLADPREDAYARLVEEYLASSSYGIRWARHWLDVVRFGESQGFERDKLRENAWPYRDFVIRAFNDDMPYDQFARWQIAGDLLKPNDPQAVIATGFLVAGPYDEVGQQQQSAAMKAVVRQDELEDIVSVIGQTFLGLTVNCARCHDHKFDPIRQQEYYQLAAALDGVRHGSRELISRENQAEAERLEAQLKTVRAELARLDALSRERLSKPGDAPAPIARWTFDCDFTDSAGTLNGKAYGAAKIEDGTLILNGQDAYVATAPLAADLRAKTLEAWVRLENLTQRGGGVIGVQTLDGNLFDCLVFAEKEPGKWHAGSDFFKRSREFQGGEERDAASRFVHLAIVYRLDGTIIGYRDGKPYGKPYKTAEPVLFPSGKSQVLFGLRHGAPGGNRMLSGAIAAAQLYDRALTEDEIARSAAAQAQGATAAELLAALSDEERDRRKGLQVEIDRLVAQRSQVKPLSAYVVVPQSPGISHLLLRGNPAAKGEPVSPGGITAVKGPSARFDLAPDAADADRRLKLADWIADRHNPLFARVIVNRLWHYHFGVGLVDTPNDFGFNGSRPTHPELIDYLANELIRSGWQLKTLHRLIVNSATYRQSSRLLPDAVGVDAENRLLWRKSPMRLEAEALRDATIWTAGQLNAQMGGPGFRDFTTYVSNTQFYEMLDPDGPEFNRRSVYRTWIRSGRSGLLDAFDCPDPSTKTPRRAVTVTPLQALTLSNNSFVLRMARHFAERLQREAGAANISDQIHRGYALAYAREPSEAELVLLVPFVEQHGLAEFCRVLFNSNEFLYID